MLEVYSPVSSSNIVMGVGTCSLRMCLNSFLPCLSFVGESRCLATSVRSLLSLRWCSSSANFAAVSSTVTSAEGRDAVALQVDLRERLELVEGFDAEESLSSIVAVVCAHGSQGS